MSVLHADAPRTARRLVRSYPRGWRDRYGDEFCAMVESEIEAGELSVRRALDVVWSGVVTRASATGLVGAPCTEDRQSRASLVWLSVTLFCFLAFGLAMWSQLIVGWQWTSPRTTDTTVATVVMSAAVLCFLALGLLAIVPIVATVAFRIARGEGQRLAVPTGIVVLAAATLVIGARHFENGWPGTGGHHWALQGIVPGGFAAFVWAATLAVSSYWAHPGALSAFPTSEVAWMVVSPLAMLALVGSAATVLRRVELTARVSRFELRVGQGAALVMTSFFFGACLWLLDGQVRPRSVPSNLFHVGAIDIVGIAVMCAAMLCAHHVVHRGLRAARDTARTTPITS